ncbi:MAG: hypothetical protein HC841_06650 [Verrucomicrobiae bacterium]|nr:hypothetical protein [Verrucomicrobiae bacterium]
MRVLEIVRHGVSLVIDPKNTQLAQGDRLVLALRPKGFVHTRSIAGVDLAAEMELGVETIAAHEGSLVEAIISPQSALLGRSLREVNFRQRYRCIVLAVHRRGQHVRKDFEQAPLEFGDILLMMGTDRALDDLRASDDLFLLDRHHTPSQSLRRRMPWVVGLGAAMILFSALGWAPIAALALVVAVILMLTGVLTPKEAYGYIEWRILILIFGMLGLGMAMETTGADVLIAQTLAALADVGGPESWRPYILLALICASTALLTELLSNNAAIVLMGPIALSLGDAAGVDPRAFLIGTAIAASASFATPIGYQTNTYVYGVGGYKFVDFIRIGIPLNVWYFIGSVTIIPLVWGF